MRWYITVEAVCQYMDIQGYRGDSDSLEFFRAESELAGLCEQAEFKKDWAHDGKPRQLWQVRADVRGKRQRIELTVSTEPRPEGDLPQLVRVRLKG